MFSTKKSLTLSAYTQISDTFTHQIHHFMPRPSSNEYAPFYAGYIAKVERENPLEFLLEGKRQTVAFFQSIPLSHVLLRYAPDKWSIKEILGHLTDAERVMAYRAMRFARRDTTELPGFDENAYVPVANFDEMPMSELLDMYKCVRDATLSLARSFKEDDFVQLGKANKSDLSVRALLYIIAGHEIHHINVIKERYLG